jgi:hypothetical protein
LRAQTRPQRSKGGAGSPLAPDPQPPPGGKGSAPQKKIKKKIRQKKLYARQLSLESKQSYLV